MGKKLLNGMLSALILFFIVSTAMAQAENEDVYWHISPDVETCSIVIDPSLTQDQLAKFAKQVGPIASFKAMNSAEPIGKANIVFGIEQSYTPIDQHDLAWINTFTHPDADCPLGDAVTYPTLRAAIGITERIDIGSYITYAPGANYGFLAGEMKYAFLHDSEKSLSAAMRATYTTMLGVADMDMSIYGVDISVSKKLEMFTPYLGIRQIFTNVTEETGKVVLDSESIWGTQGIIGAIYTISWFSLAAEYDIADVNTFALKTGFDF